MSFESIYSGGICEGFRGRTALVVGKDLVGRELAFGMLQMGCNVAFGDVDSGWAEEIWADQSD